ncbi:zinc finger protein 62 [Hyalella azteca]|uniref:Zinc finger protein 62 n=1 Tax=Hyalella azteca TaxID=294128 RepID=A0A8B7NF66_HYAAZ|nr:zinc finger protein 62 [Hyalella azteca]XP_018012262.1 zinc finger protein 62 [Hyalella azteca]
MAPRKQKIAPKQSSMKDFLTPSKKRKEPDHPARSPSPRKAKRQVEANNNNNNNNNIPEKKKKTKKNETVKKSPPKKTSPKEPKVSPRRGRKLAKEEESELVIDEEEQEPQEILGFDGNCQEDGIIDHGEQFEEEDEEEEADDEREEEDDGEVQIDVEHLQQILDGEEALAAGERDANSDSESPAADGNVGSPSSTAGLTTCTAMVPSAGIIQGEDGRIIFQPDFNLEAALASSDPNEVKVQVFKCKKCDNVFRNRYYMRKHMLMDHEHQLYKCRICAFTSVFPEKLKSHIIKQHVCKKEKSEALTVQTLKNESEVFEQQAPRKIIMIDGVPLGKVKKVPQCYICDVCGRIYSSKFSLERHVRCHTGERPYECDVCDFSTSYREHMQRHMTSVHLVVHSDEPKKKYIPKHRRTKVENEEEEETSQGGEGSPAKKRRNILRKRFECAACGIRSTHKSDLVEHIKEKHPKAHIVSLDNNDGSKVHLVVTASKKPREIRKFTATCSYCSKVFNDNWKYMVHLRSHTGVKPFSCSECDFHATTKMTVRDHIHRKHANCPDAKLILKLVNITDGSVEEVAIDVPQKEFKCELCNTVFPGNYELKTHKFKEHPEAKPFSCTECEHREWARANIIIHCCEKHPECDLEDIILRNGHPTKIGPINLPKCDTCSKMFPYQSLLYLHQRTHTGERNYGCDSCDFRTDSKKALTRHILKKHLDTHLKGKNKKRPKRATKDMATGTDDIDAILPNDVPVSEDVINEARALLDASE